MWDNSVIGYFRLMQSRFRWWKVFCNNVDRVFVPFMSVYSRMSFFLELGSWEPYSSLCQTSVDSRSTLPLFQEKPPGKVAAGHQLVVVAMAAVLLVVMGLAVFADFFFLPSDSSGTSLLVFASLVRPAERDCFLHLYGRKFRYT